MATCSDSHIENSKNHKKVILPITTSPKCQCAADGIISVFCPKSVITMVNGYIEVYEVSSFDGFGDMSDFLGVT